MLKINGLKIQWNTIIIFKIMWTLFKKFENKCKYKVFEDLNVYVWPCFLVANAKTVLKVDFQMAFWGARSV